MCAQTEKVARKKKVMMISCRLGCVVNVFYLVCLLVWCVVGGFFLA